MRIVRGKGRSLMREQDVPVFYDEKSSTSSQYANTIQGIRMAAARYGMHLNLFSDADFDKTEFYFGKKVADYCREHK